MSKNFQKVMAKIMESKGSNILHFCLLNQCVLNNSAIPFIPSKIRKNTAILVDKKFTLKKYSWFIYLISNCHDATLYIKRQFELYIYELFNSLSL